MCCSPSLYINSHRPKRHNTKDPNTSHLCKQSPLTDAKQNIPRLFPNCQDHVSSSFHPMLAEIT